MRDSFFVKFKNCLHRLDKFPRYIDQGVGKAIKYGFLISLIFGGIIGIYNCVLSNGYINKGVQELNNPKYAFAVKDNTLDMKAEPIKIDQNGSMIYVNDNKTLSEANGILDSNPGNVASVLILKDGVLVNGGGVETNATYSQISSQIFNSQEINNKTVGEKIQSMKKYYFVFQFVYNVLEKFINLVIDSLFISVIGLIASMLFGMLVKPSALYSLAIYAATVPFLISLPISIIFPEVNMQMPLLIATAIYVVIILKSIKNDLVKRKEGSNKNDKTSKFL
ncbi:MAG: DUF1189 domain-containing protein [Clostridium sp.]|uniref:DUF1189 domain-containing protein n=1 Tax=Clostridium sp. TaxID=1506 RepID=UPI003F383B1D